MANKQVDLLRVQYSNASEALLNASKWLGEKLGDFGPLQAFLSDLLLATDSGVSDYRQIQIANLVLLNKSVCERGKQSIDRLTRTKI